MDRYFEDAQLCQTILQDPCIEMLFFANASILSGGVMILSYM